MNKSDASDSFDFGNELELSQTNRKNKTGDNYNTKEFYEFEDFMKLDRDDKTIKSDKADNFPGRSNLHNSSHHSKKSQADSQLQGNNNIIDFLTDQSIKSKSVIGLNKSLLYPEDNGRTDLAGSPKFGEAKEAKGLQSSYNSLEFTLRRKESLPTSFPPVQLEHLGSHLQSQMKRKDQLQKIPEEVKEISKEEEFKDLNAKIAFYKQSMDRLLYESYKIEESTEELIGKLNNSQNEELEKQGEEIKAINREIENQKNLQSQLHHIDQKLDVEYDELVQSVRSMQFKRPTLIRDEAKVLIDQIRQLKGEFEALERDHGSLNLSSTMMQPSYPNSYSNRQLVPSKKDASLAPMLEEIFHSIYEENKVSEDPRFLHNLKMSCLRDEWTIYSNSDLQMNLSFRSFPKARLHIGNKNVRDLQKMSIFENGAKKFDSEILKGKSYIIYEIQTNQLVLKKLFIEIRLSYQTLGSMKDIRFFVPTGITNFGEFSPVTEKEFRTDPNIRNPEISTTYRPIDRAILQDISECAVYMPNLLVDASHGECYGLFISSYNQHSLIVLREKNGMLSVASKSPEWHLVRVLEFIFTL